MKIIVIDATGTIGRAVVEGLSGRHEVIKVGHGIKSLLGSCGIKRAVAVGSCSHVSDED